MQTGVNLCNLIPITRLPAAQDCRLKISIVNTQSINTRMYKYVNSFLTTIWILWSSPKPHLQIIKVITSGWKAHAYIKII